MTTAAEIKGRREEWKKELNLLWLIQFFIRIVAFVVLSFAGLIEVLSLTNKYENKPIGQWSSDGVMVASALTVLVMVVAIYAPILLTRGLSSKIQNLRKKAIALLEVQIESLPGLILLLWQRSEQKKMLWELATSTEVEARLAVIFQTGFVLVTRGGCEGYESVLAFLQSWDERNPARQMIAKELGDPMAYLTEECRHALYLAEFKREH